MLFATIGHPNKIRIIIIFTILMTIGAISIVFIRYRRALSDPEEFIASVPLKADLSISEIHQVATRDGRKEWRLDAASAHYLNAEKQVILKDLSMTFFLENQREVILTANRGVLMTESKDVTVNGNVVLNSDDSHLTTEKLHYQHEHRRITSRSPVEIRSNTYQLTAESMTLDLNKNRAEFSGNVRGTFSEDFSL